MRVFCPKCGGELVTVDTKTRAGGVKRRTRRCPGCRATWVSEVYEQRMGDAYLEMETIQREGKKNEG